MDPKVLLNLESPLTILPNKFIFFYSEYGVRGHIEYSVFPANASGSVCVERALEVAAEYAKKGYGLVFGQSQTGRQLPIYVDERRPFFAGLFEFEDKQNCSKINLLRNATTHPGWAHLKSIRDAIPAQVL